MLGLANIALSAPGNPSERAQWLAGMAAESYEKRDFVRSEILCLIAIELDPYCIPARRTLEKLSPPVSQGTQRSRELEVLSAADQHLRVAQAELEEAEKKVAAQQKDPDSQKYFAMAREAWKRFSHAESQLRAFKSTQGASHGFNVTYLRTLTEMMRERTQQLREQAKVNL